MGYERGYMGDVPIGSDNTSYQLLFDLSTSFPRHSVVSDFDVNVVVPCGVGVVNVIAEIESVMVRER